MTVVDMRTSIPVDDGHYSSSTGSTFLFSGTGDIAQNLGDSFSGIVGVWQRYRTLPITQGSVIDVATMTVDYQTPGTSGSLGVRINAENSDNSADPTSAADMRSRARTTANTTLTMPTHGLTYSLYTTPSLIGLVQEVINRPGWVSGNTLMLMWERTSGATDVYQQIHTHEFSSSVAPLLHIEYTPANTAPTINVAPSVTYGSLTRLGPNNTPATATFTATDAEQTAAGALSYTIRTAASGGGTLVGSGTATSGVSKQHSIANADPGLVDGSQTLYVRVYDGVAYSADSAFTLLRDTGAPTVGAIAHSPNPVT